MREVFGIFCGDDSYTVMQIGMASALDKPVQNGDGLFPGNIGIRMKHVAAGAIGDTVVICPLYGPRIKLLLFYIIKRKQGLIMGILHIFGEHYHNFPLVTGLLGLSVSSL